jgi:3-polyprenyl-4-hydroxybenzoate decarboxylase
MAECVAGLPGGSNSTAKAIIEPSSKKTLSEIRVAEPHFVGAIQASS